MAAAAPGKSKDSEYGVISTSEDNNICFFQENQYCSMHFVRQQTGSNTLVVNVHFRSNQDANGVNKLINKILVKIADLKKIYRFDDFVIGGDINLPVKVGSTTDDKKSKQLLEEAQENVGSICKNLEKFSPTAGVEFEVTLPEHAIQKTRYSGDGTLNNQVHKSDTTVKATELVIRGKFVERPAPLTRPSDKDCFDPNPVVFDVMHSDPTDLRKSNLDHWPIGVTLEDGTYLMFCNALTTTGVKGIVEDPFKSGSTYPRNDFTEKWTTGLVNAAREAAQAAGITDKIESIAQQEKFMESFGNFLFNDPGTKMLRSALKEEFQTQASPDKLVAELNDKITDKLKNKKAPECKVEALVTQVCEAFSRQPLGGFIANETYQKKLVEIGAKALTIEIEGNQMATIHDAAKRQGKDPQVSVIFLQENNKATPAFESAGQKAAEKDDRTVREWFFTSTFTPDLLTAIRESSVQYLEQQVKDKSTISFEGWQLMINASLGKKFTQCSEEQGKILASIKDFIQDDNNIKSMFKTLNEQISEKGWSKWFRGEDESRNIVRSFLANMIDYLAQAIHGMLGLRTRKQEIDSAASEIQKSVRPKP